jgi:hypothetical protein
MLAVRSALLKSFFAAESTWHSQIAEAILRRKGDGLAEAVGTGTERAAYIHLQAIELRH